MADCGNPGIPFTAFLVPSGTGTFSSSSTNPNFSVMASQEDTIETASEFANRLVGELVPSEFVRALCGHSPDAIAAGAVVADFGHGRFMYVRCLMILPFKPFILSDTSIQCSSKSSRPERWTVPSS